MTEKSNRLSLRRYAVVLALVGAMGSGCVMSPRSAAALGHLAAAAVYTAAIIGTVSLLAHHDAHFHFETCGHYRRYHHGRWVYQYQGRWEYYDSYAGSWYYYAD